MWFSEGWEVADVAITHTEDDSTPRDTDTAYREALGRSALNLSLSTVFLCQSRVRRHALGAAARSVGQSLYALLEKPLHPLVDKATADPDRRGNVGDRHPISDE